MYYRDQRQPPEASSWPCSGQDFPDKDLSSEHLPDNPWIITEGRFCATWAALAAHHECQRPLAGQDPLNKVLGFLGLGRVRPRLEPREVHPRVARRRRRPGQGQCRGRSVATGTRRHRYFIDQLGGREDMAARAKCRLARALNVAMPGTPLLFTGLECLMAAPNIASG